MARLNEKKQDPERSNDHLVQVSVIQTTEPARFKFFSFRPFEFGFGFRISSFEFGLNRPENHRIGNPNSEIRNKGRSRIWAESVFAPWREISGLARLKIC